MLRSSRFVAAAIAVVIVINVYIFTLDSSRDSKYAEVLQDAEVVRLDNSGTAPLSALIGATPDDVRLEAYHDARAKGILVVSHEHVRPEDMTPEQKRASDELFKLTQVPENERDYAIYQIEHFARSEPAAMAPQTLESLAAYGKFTGAFGDFMGKLVETIDKHKPAIDKINNDEHYKAAKDENKHENKDGKIPVYGGHWREAYLDEPVRTKEYLSYFLRLSGDEVGELKKKHHEFLGSMPAAFPDELFTHGAQFGFMEGNGIVYLGGARYNQLVLLSLSVLRAKGSTLPAEVVMPYRKDFDIDLCNNVLPGLNARCRILEDFLPAAVLERIKGYQLKNVALLMSSFANVLYLDADNIPVRNPDYLFVNEPFKSSRMVMWPDLWRRSTSPHFYDIADFPVQSEKLARNSYHESDPRGKYDDSFHFSLHDTEGAIPEVSSETGQMMIDKRVHAKSLFLAMYYNFYGPDYYYPLLSQGAAGEGDKETFIAAAERLKLPYYQVGEYNREFGPIREHGKRYFFGMGQYDPIVDFVESKGHNRRSPAPEKYAKNEKDDSVTNYDSHLYRASALMFLHANWPKYYVDEMFEKNSHGRGVKDKEGKRRRLYTDSIMQETGGVDIELEIMSHMKVWYCATKLNLQDVAEHGSDRRKKICEGIEEQLNFLKSH